MDKLWEKFFKSGKISDYIRYKQAENINDKK